MANTLKSIINVKANDEAIKNLTSKLDELKYNDITNFAQTFYENVEISGGGVMNSWSLDNLGSKWTYFVDASSDDEFIIDSAWYPPKEFFIHLYKMMSSIDPETIIEVRYEDESYNPVGAFLIKKDENGDVFYSQNEEEGLENPTDDMDWDDENYDQVQMDFMDSVYEKIEEMLRLCYEDIDNGDGYDLND